MTYHFIGLGGIGMSALARILLQRGVKVQGSDLSQSLLLQGLSQEGAQVQIGHSVENIPQATTVVYSSDVKADNVELKWAKEHNMQVLHRSDLLHELMKGKKNLLVAGTHGKTTTTALLASVLIEAGLDPSFVVGGLLRSLNTNGRAGKGDHFVAEADESDGSFLKTPADFAILTNLSDDHLDYWGSSRALDLAFKQFGAQTKNLIWCFDDERLKSLNLRGTSYGFSAQADVVISNFYQTRTGIRFDLPSYPKIELSLLGHHNALNGAAVFTLALALGISADKIRAAFQKFSGTARRLEFKGERHKVRVYDDYGHHPREIQATLKALREYVKERRLIVVFQPHRYTRVRDLFDSFATCFEAADEVFMTDIYSAGEAPIEGVTSASLYTRLKMKLGSKLKFFPRSHLEVGVAQELKPLDVVLTIGAGDVTKAGEPILKAYAERAPRLQVGVIFGGASAEHPVSIMSSKNIIGALNSSVYETRQFAITKEGCWVDGGDLERGGAFPRITAEVIQDLLKCDVCIPVLHGPQGEDGMIAAFLQTLGIAYVGCDYRSGAICMHKGWSKQIGVFHGVQTSPFLEFKKHEFEEIISSVEAKLSYPVWVKPVHLGSSIGVSRAVHREELVAALHLAFGYDETILVEKEILGRQIEFSVLGNDSIQLAVPAEIINHGAFVAYDKKYGSTAMEIRTPAEITEEERSKGAHLAEIIYRACDCKGLARVDFFLDQEGNFWFNEINPFPGCTDTSAYPQAWLASGFALEEIVDELISLALRASCRGRK